MTEEEENLPSHELLVAAIRWILRLDRNDPRYWRPGCCPVSGSTQVLPGSPAAGE
jgi:hypothetical protein